MDMRLLSSHADGAAAHAGPRRAKRPAGRPAGLSFTLFSSSPPKVRRSRSMVARGRLSNSYWNSFRISWVFWLAIDSD
jgi:hypothetical protein